MSKKDKKAELPVVDQPMPAGAVIVESSRFNSTDDIRLGMIARDPVTGLVGMIDKRYQLLSGTTQYCLQPMGDGKTIPDSFCIDDFLLEYVSDGISAQTIPEDTRATFRLGEKFQDEITGFTGIAEQRITYLNGCVHYYIRSNKADASGRALIDALPEGAYFDYKRLKKISDGVAPKVTKTKPAKVHEKSDSGGPTVRGPSLRAPR